MQALIRLVNSPVAVSRKDGFANYRLAEPQLTNLVCCMESCSVP